MRGIEDFISLVQLLSYQNSLSSVNLSLNTSLDYLELGENQITGIDISVNTLLEHLNLFGNQLTKIPFSPLRISFFSSTAIDVTLELNIFIVLTDLLVLSLSLIQEVG